MNIVLTWLLDMLLTNGFNTDTYHFERLYEQLFTELIMGITNLFICGKVWVIDKYFERNSFLFLNMVLTVLLYSAFTFTNGYLWIPSKHFHHLIRFLFFCYNRVHQNKPGNCCHPQFRKIQFAKREILENDIILKNWFCQKRNAFEKQKNRQKRITSKLFKTKKATK